MGSGYIISGEKACLEFGHTRPLLRWTDAGYQEVAQRVNISRSVSLMYEQSQCW